MNRLLLFFLASFLMAGCRSSKSVSSSMELQASSAVTSTTDSTALSVSHKLQHLLAEGVVNARIIRFYPPADTLPMIVIPDQPLPSSPSVSEGFPQPQPSANSPMPWLFPFGPVSSVTDIQFNGRVQQESESGSASMVQKNDSTFANSDVSSSGKASTEVKPARYPWYKQLIIFIFAVLVCGTVALILSRCRIRNMNS